MATAQKSKFSDGCGVTPQRKTYLKRSTKPIPRHKRLASSKRPIRQRRADPSKRAFAKFRVPAFQVFVREHPCPLDRKTLRFEPPEAEIGWMLLHKDCSGPIECAHIKTRGSGGADVGNCLALCRTHHRVQHELGIKTFQKRYGLPMQKVADILKERWLQTEAGQAWVHQEEQ